MNQLASLTHKFEATPNQIYLLWCMHYSIKPLEINSMAEIRALRLKGYVDKDDKITPQGLYVIDTLEPAASAVGKNKPMNGDYVKRYLELFPKGKLPSGVQSRVNEKNLEGAFKWFFKTYNYSWETVIKATAMYVDEYEKQNYLYMRNSQYFITKTNPDKTRTSELANYCALIESGDFLPDKPHFSDKVV